MPYSHLWQSSFIAQSIPVLDHPLIPESRPQTNFVLKKANFASSNQSEEDIADPLGVCESLKTTEVPVQTVRNAANTNVSAEGPLSNTLVDSSTADLNDYDPELLGFRPWKEYRREIQKNFHSKDLLSLQTSFLKTATVKQVQTKRATKESVMIGVLHDLTEEEFCRRFHELVLVLHQLWNNEKRLECIKLCREVASLMASSQSPSFYPQKFVLVTDFLETFGQLVFERLRKKANEERSEHGLDSLSSNFQTVDILENARITARNWFGKVSEIHDVIQQIYIAACMIPCMKFMDESSINDNIMRLCALACSLQHPLTSSYARCYICRIAMRLVPSNRAPHWKCLHDWIQSFQQQPTEILWPALEFIIQCIAYNAVTYDDLLPLWEYCRMPEKRSFMLRSMFSALPPLYLAEHSLNACKLLVSSEHVSCEEICAFGNSLLKTTVYEQNRRVILKSIWKVIKALSSLKSFLACCEVWLAFAARYFTVSHVHFMLETIVEKLTPDRKFEQNAPALVAIIGQVVNFSRNIADLLDAEVFPCFFQMFTDKKSACDVSFIVLNGLIAKHAVSSLNDVTLVYQVMELCKCLHDVITIHSNADEIAESAYIICRAFDRFDLKAVPEQGLSFFVAARAVLLNLDECQKYVIGRILELGLYVVRSARFSSARSAFVQACVANAYITAPSLPDPFTRVRIFIQSAETALASMAFLQVDSFLEACLQEFRVFPKDKPQQFCSLISELISFILTVPVLEQKNCIATFRTLFQCIEGYEWQSLTCNERVQTLFACLRFLYVLRNSKSTSQFMTVTNESKEHLKVDPLLSDLFDRIAPIIHQENGKCPLISIALLENLAAFAGQIDQLARAVAKTAYKKCKNADQTIIDRMTRIQFDTA